MSNEHPKSTSQSLIDVDRWLDQAIDQARQQDADWLLGDGASRFAQSLNAQLPASPNRYRPLVLAAAFLAAAVLATALLGAEGADQVLSWASSASTEKLSHAAPSGLWLDLLRTLADRLATSLISLPILFAALASAAAVWVLGLALD